MPSGNQAVLDAEDPLHVGVLGVDERSRNLLRLFFDGPCKGACELVDHDRADVTLIDLDAYGGGKLQAQHKALYPGRPAILMSIQEQPGDERLWLSKPLNGKALMSVLTTVRETIKPRSASPKPVSKPMPASAPLPPRASDSRGAVRASASVTTVAGRELSSQPGSTPESRSRAERRTADSKMRQAAGTASRPSSSNGSSGAAAEQLDETANTRYLDKGEDINPHDPGQVKRAMFSNDELLQGYLQRAIEEAERSHQTVSVKGIWRNISIDPVARSVCYELSMSQLRSLCIMPTQASKVTIGPAINVGRKASERDNARISHEPLDAFVWQIALWTSRGRVPDTVDLRQPVFLRHWPNFTRLAITPHALRITALWVDRPTTLIRTAEILGIPQRYVFAFYTAALATGLAGQGRRQSDALLETPKPKEPRHKGLLSRILTRLRGQ